MLFVGDILQLQPVNENPVFHNISETSLVYKLGCVAFVNDCVLYDDLTINERQKGDKEYSSLLDNVRRGCPTEECLSTLKQRVIQVPVSEKFHKLQQSGQLPVCPFPTRIACDEFNKEILTLLDTTVHELKCKDEVDQTKSTRNWDKKATQQLEKLSSDCNKTAGLEFVLKLAVGAHVMLRRNIDTNCGLVNGALGTVLSVKHDKVTVEFDHVSVPYGVKRVMTNLYVYREQFPLILAFAVTIHKCQGLSLDCAIVDLSEKVFSAGMAYVALSRVRTLSGLHLIAFDPATIKLSTQRLKEVNRLRETFNNTIPRVSDKTKCKKFTGSVQLDQSKTKKEDKLAS